MWRLLIIGLCFSCCSSGISAQVIDCISSFREVGDKLLRLHVDNDYFTTTDEYYTYGITLEFAHPVLRSSPLNLLLLKPAHADYRYGAALAYFCYTPRSLSSNEILYGDRPFSGNLVLSSFLTARDSLRGIRISSSIILGIIGQGAGGRESQQAVHRLTDNVDPCGWQYQIQNDLIVNYQINYEKRLTASSHSILLSYCSELRVGTHTDKLKAGLSFMAGKFEDPYCTATDRKPDKKIRWHLYGQLQPAFVLYDATLQGGLFNKQNPYTIPASDIRRFTVQADYGIVITLRRFSLEYCQSFLSPEFSGGLSHRWGGIRIGFLF